MPNVTSGSKSLVLASCEKLELIYAGTAIEDATKALAADPTYHKVVLLNYTALMYRHIFDEQQRIWELLNQNWR